MQIFTSRDVLSAAVLLLSCSFRLRFSSTPCEIRPACPATVPGGQVPLRVEGKARGATCRVPVRVFVSRLCFARSLEAVQDYARHVRGLEVRRDKP